MLRSFTLMMVLGATIVVECTGQKPELPNSQKIPQTPTNIPVVKAVVEKSPSLAREPKPAATAAPDTSREKLPACVQKDCDCTDFARQKEAQAVLKAFPDDRHGLDKNKDDVACESLPN